MIMKKAFYLVMAMVTAVAMMNVSAQVNTQDCIEKCEQDTVEEWVVDSIDEWVVDSVEADTVEVDSIADYDEMDLDQGDDFEMTDVELTKRYGLIVTGGKYGIRDYDRKENVTETIYDYANPAYRRKMENDYITYFYIREGERTGIIGIFESTNEIMTILSPSGGEE